MASSLPAGNLLAQNLIPLDPEGNLLIICKHPKKPSPFHFRVSSKVLSLASPVFASLFADPASHNRYYRLVLDDDHPEPVGTLLELCHFGRNSPLPPAQLKGINALAELSQKYAISALMVPWITAWSQPLHENDKLNFSKGNDLKQWLRISCVYNQRALFNKVTKRAVLTGSAESLDVSESPEAPYNNIIAEISPERIDVLAKIIGIILTFLSRYQTTDLTCKQPENSDRCDAILLGSVLKGIMGLGVYQPIPVTPYPGITVMSLIEGIRNLPLMADPSHSETCGEIIKKDISEMLSLAHEVSDNVRGLELKDFAANKRAGKAQGLVLTAVEEQEIQTWPQKNVVGNCDRKEEDRKEDENKGKKKLEELQEEDVEGVRRAQSNNGDNGGCGEKGGLGTATLSDTSGDGTFPPTSINIQVPAGVTTGFLETPETIEDFGPQLLFRDCGEVEEEVVEVEVEKPGVIKGEEGEKREKEIELGGEKEEEQEQKEEASTTAKKNHATTGHEIELKQEHLIHNGSEEQLMLEFKGFTPLKIQGGLPAPTSEKQETTPLQTINTKHAMSRANAEAHGHKWATPGPELVQKYQRGPRLPFHPEVTVGDISDEGHTIEIKRLRDLFPQVDTKILVEFLRKGNWSSQDAARMLCAGGILMSPANGVGGELVPVSNPLVLEPTIPSPLGSDLTIHQELEQSLNTPSKTYSSAPSIKTPTLNRVISISRLVAGRLTPEQSEARFWPEPDKVVIMRSLGLSENKKGIKKLLAMFPQASADKGFIDVLYRTGWDTEKAATHLESLGLTRQATGGSSGDGGKATSKGAEGEMGQ